MQSFNDCYRATLNRTPADPPARAVKNQNRAHSWGRITMSHLMSRRTFGGLVAATALASATPAFAQAKPTLRLNGVYGDKDIRAEAFRRFAKAVENDVTIEPHYSSTLFKQGTEVVALQRDNLEIANISPFDISRQIPEWSMLTMAYLFRDAQHVAAFFNSPVGAEWTKQVEDKMNIKILAPVYYGTRQVGLKSKKPVKTPADLAGVKLRMPPGEAWQLLGKSLGANPTPMAFGEVYTALQTGAIDGQDNPLPNVNTAKFFEVTGQFVLTAHWIAYDLLAMNMKSWKAMDEAKQGRFMKALNEALAGNTAEHLKMEGELADKFKAAGCDITVPDVAAFRAHAQKVYLESEQAKTWPKDGIAKIAAIT
jgi:TRAP-type transport system periplasmic protein